MRELVKGSLKFADADQPVPPELVAARRTRHRWRRALGCGFLILGALYCVQLLRLGQPAGLAGFGAAYDASGTAAVYHRVVGWVRGLVWQAQNTVHGALPNTHLIMILKMALCVVVAAAFLRGPRRS